MDVYKITPTNKLSHGCALVAAPCANDAEILFRDSEYRNFEFDEGNCKVTLINDIHCDTDKPKLIFDDIMLD